jgi:hypothetical protein
MRSPSRYRTEDGRVCIDVRLRSARQLFDLRDPAPFRERDLDPSAAEHLMTCLREIPRRTPVRITLFIAEESEPRLDESLLVDAIRAHFRHERDLVDGDIGLNFRHGRHLAAIGIVILTVFLMLSKLSGRLLDGTGYFHEIVKEGLVITGWVAMWRPAEVLLYDWWPLYENRRWIDKLLATEITIRTTFASIAPSVPTANAS